MHLFGMIINYKSYNLILNIALINSLILMYKLKSMINLKDKPMCQCGNTSNPSGYCDGSHNKN